MMGGMRESLARHIRGAGAGELLSRSGLADTVLNFDPPFLILFGAKDFGENPSAKAVWPSLGNDKHTSL
jgi:hypothetical protein